MKANCENDREENAGNVSNKEPIGEDEVDRKRSTKHRRKAKG